MLTIYDITNIQLKPGELVVSTVAFRDYVLVVTDRGTIYKIIHDDK